MSIFVPHHTGNPLMPSYNLSKTSLETNPTLEKRDEDQQQSQDTKQQIPRGHEEYSLEKNFTGIFRKYPKNLLWPPPLIIFSPATEPGHINALFEPQQQHPRSQSHQAQSRPQIQS